MRKPLQGIKVIDVCLAGAGPSATKLLAEYGADVIWVEPLTGTSTRSVHKFDFYTTGKRSLSIDLKTPQGHEVITRLIQTADVFVSNYRTKGLRRLGLTYEALSEVNPRLIYATITGYGETGPRKDAPGYDTVAFWGQSGMMRDIAERGTLVVPPMAVGDIATGQALAGGICAALYQRERTGKGDRVFSSLLAEAIYLNHDALVEIQYGQQYPKTRKTPTRAMLNTYPCRDGKWIAIAAPGPADFDRYFWKIMHIVGRDDLIGDPRWRCQADTMYDRATEIVSIWDEGFSQMTQDEALQALRAIDMPVSPVQGTEDALTDPQVLENKYIYRLEATVPPGPEQPDIWVPANPLKFTDSSSGVTGQTRGPRLGEHSVEVLQEYGYSEEEIDVLIRQGILHQDQADAEKPRCSSATQETA